MLVHVTEVCSCKVLTTPLGCAYVILHSWNLGILAYYITIKWYKNLFAIRILLHTKDFSAKNICVIYLLPWLCVHPTYLQMLLESLAVGRFPILSLALNVSVTRSF